MASIFEGAWWSGGLSKADKAQNAFNSAEAQKNRDYQTEMSNTAHQRAVADMKAAGINPVLAANSAASVPSGATAGGAHENSSGSADLIHSALKVAQLAIKKS